MASVMRNVVRRSLRAGASRIALAFFLAVPCLVNARDAVKEEQGVAADGNVREIKVEEDAAIRIEAANPLDNLERAFGSAERAKTLRRVQKFLRTEHRHSKSTKQFNAPDWGRAFDTALPLRADDTDGGGAGNGVAQPCETCRVDGALTCGNSTVGSLTKKDCRRSEERLFQTRELFIPERRQVTIELRSGEFDSVLLLFDDLCNLIGENDDGFEDGTDSRLTLMLNAGTYSIGVSTFDVDERGSFELSVSCTDFDLCRDCRSGELVCGASIESDFPPELCPDVVTAHGSPLSLYHWDFEGGRIRLDLHSDDYDTYLVLYDANCNVIVEADDCDDLNACLEIDLEKGEYFVGASSFDNLSTGRFTLTANCIDLGPCAECNAGEVECGVPVEAHLNDSACVDEKGVRTQTWLLELDRSSDISLDVTADFESSIRVLDRLCQPIDRIAISAGGSPHIRLPAGQYFVEVQGTPADDADGYTLSINCEGFSICLDCETQDLLCNAEVLGNLNAESCLDEQGARNELWRIELPEPTQLHLTLRSNEVECLLRLMTEDCNLIAAANNDPLNDAAVRQTLPAGTYLVSATSRKGSLGAYELITNCTEPKNFCRDCVDGQVDCRNRNIGSLDAGDCSFKDGRFIDLWELTMSERGKVDIALTAGFDTVLVLLDANCAPIAENDDCIELDSCLSLTLDPGTYFLAATSFDLDGVGAYNLDVSCPTAPVCEDCSSGTMTPGRNESSLQADSCQRVNGSNIDFWAFELDQLQSVRLEANSDAFDTTLWIYDDGCQLIASNDDCDGLILNSCVEIELEAGRYWAAVSSVFPNESGSYELALELGDSSEGGQIAGDCTQDGSLNAADALCILGYLFFNKPTTLPCGDGLRSEAGNRTLLDGNSDDHVDVSDAVRILQFFFLNGPPLPGGKECRIIAECPSVCSP